MSPEEALRATAYQILEDGLFMFLDEPLGELEPDAVAYSLTAAGAEVGLRISRPAACTLAAHMLGRDESEVEQDDVGPAVAEALNMVAGPLVAHIIGAEREIDLGIPAPGGAPHGDAVSFSVEGGGLELWYAA